ncbi:MAG: GNAT family N-acetyltransferase [Anaerolineae bacterium]
MLIRSANEHDIPALLRLVSDHARRGDLLPRTALSIRDTLADWLVAEDEEGIAGCISLLHYSPILAEVRSLAVADRYKGNGVGGKLLTAIVDEANSKELTKLFALTRAVRFFEQAGFTVTEKADFPEKIWRDCFMCPIKEACDEVAVVLQL